jgi:hypothetical protein
MYETQNIAAYTPVAGQGPRSEQRDNGCCLVTAVKRISNTRAIARQLLGKRVPEATDTQATVEVLLDSNNGNSAFHVFHTEIL